MSKLKTIQFIGSDDPVTIPVLDWYEKLPLLGTILGTLISIFGIITHNFPGWNWAFTILFALTSIQQIYQVVVATFSS